MRTLRKIQKRIKETWIWKWGGDSSKNGWNVVGYCTLLCFAVVAQVRTEESAANSSRALETASQIALDLSLLNSDLIYKIQLTDYTGCIRSEADQQKVETYNRNLLNYAENAGIDVEVLYEDLDELFTPHPPCIEPKPQVLITVPEG